MQKRFLEVFQDYLKYMSLKMNLHLILGIGKRKLINDDTLLLGANLFYDHELDYDHQRASIGIEAISHKEKTIPILTERLQAGKLIALVADRDLSATGIDVKFFDGVARMPAGPARKKVKTSFARSRRPSHRCHASSVCNAGGKDECVIHDESGKRGTLCLTNASSNMANGPVISRAVIQSMPDAFAGRTY